MLNISSFYIALCIIIHIIATTLTYIYIYIIIRRTRHAGNCWRSRDKLISDVLLWTPTHGCAKAGWPAQTYIQQLCEDTGCCPEDLPEAMNDREKWRERVRDIPATSTTWWWGWWYIIIMSCHQHGYPWPSHTTFPYCSSPLAGLQGYIPYPHIAAECMFVLGILLLPGHVWRSIGIHRLWARPCFSSSVLHVWFV